MRRVSSDEALEGLYGQVFLIDDAGFASDILGYADQLLRNIPVYELQCTMGEEAVRCSFEELTKLNYAAEIKRARGQKNQKRNDPA